LADRSSLRRKGATATVPTAERAGPMAGKTALTASASDNDAWTAPQDGMSSLFIRLSPGGVMGGGVPAIESGPSSRITAIAAVQ